MISKKYYTHISLCSVLILILIGTYFYTMYKESFQNSNVETSVIPLKIFQTFGTKNLPKEIKTLVNRVQQENPEFEYYLFDDNDCRAFIQEHFDEDVVNAYDTLVPGAFKADLWRLCVLYIHGGMYMDIKLRNADGVKLISLTDKEYFVRDMDGIGGGQKGVYNAFMVAKPKNPKIRDAIDLIVHNVQTRFYGINPLDPTGPNLLKNVFTEQEIDAFDMYLTPKDANEKYLYIDIEGKHIICLDKSVYTSYKTKTKTYHDHWMERTMYK